MLEGEFPEDIRNQFRKLLEYFGQSPIIVRSSSILEDGFGNAFAGKYDSVFCVNAGESEDRLVAFEDAVRRVYASTMNLSALEYRKARGLSKRDEQMSLLVQRVSGSYYGEYFFPDAAGVGYSYSTYKVCDDMDMKAGLLRVVLGLGTRAVDRTQGDYPRLISIDKPKILMYQDYDQRHKYSQHKVDVLSIITNKNEELDLDKVINLLPSYTKKQLLEHNKDVEEMFESRGINRDIYFASLRGLAENEEFIELAKRVLLRFYVSAL